MEGLQSTFQWKFLLLLSAKMARTGQDSPNWTLLLSNHSPALECSGLRDSGGSWKGKLLRLEWKVITEGEEWPDMSEMVCDPS